MDTYLTKAQPFIEAIKPLLTLQNIAIISVGLILLFIIVVKYVKSIVTKIVIILTLAAGGAFIFWYYSVLNALGL